MKISEMTLGEVVTEYPGASAILSKYGVDFCCGGARRFAEALRGHGLDPHVVGNEIVAQRVGGRRLDVKLGDFSTLQLIEHILNFHHAYVRAQRVPLLSLAGKVVEVHGARHPEYREAATLLAGMLDELELHMRKEEEILFPAIIALAGHEATGVPVPETCFGSVANPIRMMEIDHRQTGDELFRLQKITSGYVLPDDACASCEAFYQGMYHLQENTFEHVHLENNILFPRALELERAACVRP